MESDHGLAGPGRSGHSRRSPEAPCHQVPLSRMKEDRPLLPGVRQGLLQLLPVFHDTETPLRIGMRKGIGNGRGHRNDSRLPSSRQFQQRLGRLSGQVISKLQKRVFRGR
jgi:hypothetical protein